MQMSEETVLMWEIERPEKVNINFNISFLPCFALHLALQPARNIQTSKKEQN